MLSRLIITATRTSRCRVFSLLAQNKAFERGLATFSTGSYRERTFPTGRKADPVVHAGEPNEDEAEEAAKHAEASQQEQDRKAISEETHHFVPPKTPFASSPHLESTEVNPPVDPKAQQTRKKYNLAIQNVSCDVGIDGMPLRSGEKEDGHERVRQVQELNDKDYYKDHKASPLSELEFADTRKPIARAMDSTADYYLSGGNEGDVVLFSKEQLDTAEDSLRRATEIWRENAMRGDPDSPHGRVLRAIRGESW